MIIIAYFEQVLIIYICDQQTDIIQVSIIFKSDLSYLYDKPDGLTISIESCFYRVTEYCVIKLQGWWIYLVIGMWDRTGGTSPGHSVVATSTDTRVGTWSGRVGELVG